MALSINVGPWNGVPLRNQPGGARLCRDFPELLLRERQRQLLRRSLGAGEASGRGGSSVAGAGAAGTAAYN